MSRVFSEELVNSVAKEMKVADLANATIGDVLLVASRLEELTGIPFIRMDQGSPGLPANKIGIEAEKKALDRGVGSQYPAAAGVAELKQAASRFVKAFIDINISPRACLPTTGSVAASFGAFIACTQRIPGKNKVLFIDPGFPIQKSQLRILGIEWGYKNLSCAFWVLSGSCSTFMISVVSRCVPNWKVSCRREILPLWYILIQIIRHGFVWKKVS